MAGAVRWGIIGTGGICRDFVQAVAGSAAGVAGEVVAVGSRSEGGAAAFADTHAIAGRHGSYAALLADPAVDAVYIGTPHPTHADIAVAAARAGKHVLLEKPLTMHAGEAERVRDAVRDAGVFGMEAMWTRFFPAFRHALREVEAGTIGEVLQVTADLSFRHTFDAAHRLYAPELGGGALLDVGVYPVSLASAVFGGAAPARVAARATKAPTGVDSHFNALLEYECGGVAMLSAGVTANSARAATIMGTKGLITLHFPFWHPSSVTVAHGAVPGNQGGDQVAAVQDTRTFTPPVNGMEYEAEHVVSCIRQGLTESPLMPLAESITVMRTLDRIRDEIGVHYEADATRRAE